MEESECMVCFSPVNDTNDCQLACKHLLCFGCLTKLVNNTCPMCRRTLSSKLPNIEKYLRVLDPKDKVVVNSRNTQSNYNVQSNASYVFNAPVYDSYIGNDLIRSIQGIDLYDDGPAYADFGGNLDVYQNSRTMEFNQESVLKLLIRHAKVTIQETNNPNIMVEMIGDELENVTTDNNSITIIDSPGWASLIISVPNNIKPNLHLNLSRKVNCLINLESLDASLSGPASANFENINRAIINIGGMAKCKIRNILDDLVLDAAGASKFKVESIKKCQIDASGKSKITIGKIESDSIIQASGSSLIKVNQSSGITANLSGKSDLEIINLNGHAKLSGSGSSRIQVTGIFVYIHNTVSDTALILTIGHCREFCTLSASGIGELIHRGKVEGQIRKIGGTMTTIYVSE